MVPDDWETNLSRAEMAVIRRIAERDGVSLETAANRLASEWLARKVKKKTGKRMARVYAMRKR